jgi:hypothetical protein
MPAVVGLLICYSESLYMRRMQIAPELVDHQQSNSLKKSA